MGKNFEGNVLFASSYFFCVIWIQMDILSTSKALFRPSQDDPLYRLVVKSLEKWLAISNMKVCDPKWKVKVWVWHLRRRKAWGCCRSLCTCDTFDQTLLWIKFMFIVHFVVSDGNDILLKMLHFLDCLFPHVEADPSMVGLPPYENKIVLSPHIGIVFTSQNWQLQNVAIKIDIHVPNVCSKISYLWPHFLVWHLKAALTFTRIDLEVSIYYVKNPIPL